MNLKNIKIDFIYYSKFCFFTSIFIIVISLVSAFWLKPNIGIDFIGGTMLEIKIDNPQINVENIRKALNDNGYNKAVLYDANDVIVIKIKSQNKENIAFNIKQLLSEKYPISYQKVDFVGSNVSQKMIQSGILSVFFALLGVMLYIYLRFNIIFAISAIMGIIHDISVLLGFFILSRIEFNIPAIAAILTIIGYSINDTVVIFDRIRKQIKSTNNLISSDIINKSINLTLSRTIMTSFTTLLATISMIIFSKGELRSFSTIIFVGVIIGTYSSIFFVPYTMCILKPKLNISSK